MADGLLSNVDVLYDQLEINMRECFSRSKDKIRENMRALLQEQESSQEQPTTTTTSGQLPRSFPNPAAGLAGNEALSAEEKTVFEECGRQFDECVSRKLFPKNVQGPYSDEDGRLFARMSNDAVGNRISGVGIGGSMTNRSRSRDSVRVPLDYSAQRDFIRSAAANAGLDFTFPGARRADIAGGCGGTWPSRRNRSCPGRFNPDAILKNSTEPFAENMSMSLSNSCTSPSRRYPSSQYASRGSCPMERTRDASAGVDARLPRGARLSLQFQPRYTSANPSPRSNETTRSPMPDISYQGRPQAESTLNRTYDAIRSPATQLPDSYEMSKAAFERYCDPRDPLWKRSSFPFDVGNISGLPPPDPDEFNERRPNLSEPRPVHFSPQLDPRKCMRESDIIDRNLIEFSSSGESRQDSSGRLRNPYVDSRKHASDATAGRDLMQFSSSGGSRLDSSGRSVGCRTDSCGRPRNPCSDSRVVDIEIRVPQQRDMIEFSSSGGSRLDSTGRSGACRLDSSGRSRNPCADSRLLNQNTCERDMIEFSSSGGSRLDSAGRSRNPCADSHLLNQNIDERDLIEFSSSGRSGLDSSGRSRNLCADSTFLDLSAQTPLERNLIEFSSSGGSRLDSSGRSYPVQQQGRETSSMNPCDRDFVQFSSSCESRLDSSNDCSSAADCSGNLADSSRISRDSDRGVPKKKGKAVDKDKKVSKVDKSSTRKKVSVSPAKKAAKKNGCCCDNDGCCSKACKTKDKKK